MAFEPEINKVATRIADMGYQFLDPDPLGSEPSTAEYSAQVLDQDGAIIHVRNGDMIPHALPEEIQTMRGLFAIWRMRAESEMIPE